MKSISEKLEEYFFNNIDLCDQKLIQFLALNENECEEKFREEPHLFKEYFNTAQVLEPETETESDSDEEKTNLKTVKFEDDMSDDDDYVETSAAGSRRRRNKGLTEFRMPMHKGIPNSRNSATPIGILNLDYITNLDEREEIIKRWSTEISLIIQTNPEDFESANTVLTLIEHKTSGIVQNQVKMVEWKQDLHGLDFFRGIINMFYTIFLGKDYLNNELSEIEKRAEKARSILTKLQLLQICHLDEFTCIYEKNLYDIPFIQEHNQWITAYLMKLPVIGDQCLERWRIEATNDYSKISLALATRIAKEEITKICNNRFKQKKLKNLSLDCCKTVGHFQDLRIGKDSFKEKKAFYKKKYKKKYSSSWKKKKKKFSPGKYFKKSSEEQEPPKKNNCPQGKKKCRCWVCSEEGQYANECPNRKQYPEKIRILQTAINDGYKPLEEVYEGEQRVHKIQILPVYSSEEDFTDESD